MLDESICRFSGVRSILLLFILFFMEKPVIANIVEPDQRPYYVASEVGLHCLPMTLLRISC